MNCVSIVFLLNDDCLEQVFEPIHSSHDRYTIRSKLEDFRAPEFCARVGHVTSSGCFFVYQFIVIDADFNDVNCALWSDNRNR